MTIAIVLFGFAFGFLMQHARMNRAVAPRSRTDQLFLANGLPPASGRGLFLESIAAAAQRSKFFVDLGQSCHDGEDAAGARCRHRW